MKENIPGLILKMLEVITLHNPLSLCVPPYICTLKINEKTRTQVPRRRRSERVDSGGGG